MLAWPCSGLVFLGKSLSLSMPQAPLPEKENS